MNFLFWLFWIIDLLLVFLLIGGSHLRSSFGASTDLNSWMLIVVVIILIASMILRFTIKQKWIYVLVAALPAIGLFILYLLDKKSG